MAEKIKSKTKISKGRKISKKDQGDIVDDPKKKFTGPKYNDDYTGVISFKKGGPVKKKSSGKAIRGKGCEIK